jgi:fumarate reductase flavoprotein subunit
MVQTILTDVLVVGAGLAGERAAIEASSHGHDVIVLSLVPPRRSHSSAAQGGMQASLGNCAKGLGDNPDVHFADTVKGSDWGADQDRVRLFCNLAPVAVRQLAHWGVPWNRVVPGRKQLPKDGSWIEDLPEKEGLITARDFGGVAKWRCAYTADGTGHTMLYAMDNVVVQLGVKVHDRMEAISVIHHDGICHGVVARNLRDGNLRVYLAKATIIATGGAGRIYGMKSTNAVISEGMGQSICLDTGVVPLGNMEAIQFHPTGLAHVSILMTEGARGDGGYLLDKNQHRFMPDYEPEKKELASRDVVSRRMVQHMQKGLGIEEAGDTFVWLDVRHLGREHLETNLRDICELARDFVGVDPVTELVPVRPTQHYTMGGVRTDIDGHAYGLKGLFAAGEAGCWDMHGFNRLGGNSVAETVVMGMVVGEKVAEYIQGHDVAYPTQVIRDAVAKQEDRIQRLIAGADGKENCYQLHTAMADILEKKVHIFRDGEDLKTAVGELQEVHARSKKIGLHSNGLGVNPELAQALRIPGMVRMALCVAYGALQRTESRGSHFREDYPARDDQNWLNRTLAYWDEGADLPRLEYEEIVITESPPGDRGYGESTGRKG